MRALEPADTELLYEWENDTSIWGVSNTLTPFSRFQLEQYIMNAQEDIVASKQLRLMIERTDGDGDPLPLGTIDLFEYDAMHQRCGIGILIREPYREQGYGTEALETLIRYAFSKLRLHQLYCHISAENTASIRMFEKSGFVKCGVRKDWVHQADGWHDEWMFQLVNHDG